MIFVVVILVGAGFFALRSTRRQSGTHPELGAVAWVDGTRWRVLAPLARVELRQLLLHPATVTGVLATPLLVALSLGDVGDAWQRVSLNLALALVPFGWFVIIAANLLTTRPTRTGSADLLASLPAPQPVRTGALLATMAGPFVLVASMAGVAVGYAARIERFTGSPDLLEIGAALFIGAGAVTVGVALARFFPHPVFGLVGVIAVIVIQARFFEITSWPWNEHEAHPARFLGFLAMNTSVPPELEYRPAGWHLVYLVGLVAVMAAVALSRDGINRAVVTGLAVGVAIAAVGGWMQTRPAPASRVAEMVRYLEQPAKFQRCENTATTRYCTFDRADIEQWEARASAVRALAPVGGRTLVVRERVPTIVSSGACSPVPFVEGLAPEVAERIDPSRVWPRDAAVHPGTDTLPCSGESVRGYFFATQVGAWAVGLPPSPHGLDERCYADGEARAVIALWLGAAASPGGADRLRRFVADEDTDHLRFAGWSDPPMWGVRFAVSDARVALTMLARPNDEVGATIRSEWTRLTAPGTPAGELTALLGLTAVPHSRGLRTCT